jgi:hypothetical protein
MPRTPRAPLLVLLFLIAAPCATAGSACSPEATPCACGPQPTGTGYCPNGVTEDACHCPLYEPCAGFCLPDGGGFDDLVPCDDGGTHGG